MAAQLFSAALRMMQSLIDEQSGLTGTQNQPNPTAHPCTGNISEGFREPKPLHLRHSVLAYHLLLSVSEGAMPRWAFPFAPLLGGLAVITPAAANPIDTTLTLTGVPRAWVYTLDITNNTALYVFEVDVPNPFAGGFPVPAGWVGTGGYPHRGGLLQ